MTTATLEDVLVAASARIVALAPETSGYLALAVADAASRLPLAVDDRSILLGPEGTLTVPHRGDVIAPREAARMQRERLKRLLSVSAGSMPALAAAAKARPEVDVDAVAASIEGALIPLNRGAAKRAIARLARQLMQLKESGSLPEPASVHAREPARAEPIARIVTPAALASIAQEDEPDGAHVADAMGELSPYPSTDPRPRELTPTILGVGQVGPRSEAPRHAPLDEPTWASFADEDASATALDPECAVAPIGVLDSPEPSQALTVVPTGVDHRPLEQSRPDEPITRAASDAPSTSAKRPTRAELAPATQSDVDELLASFGVADSRDPLRIAASLKTMAGLEATAAPPIVWESPRPRAARAIERPAIAAPAALERASAPPPIADTPRRRSYGLGLGVLTALLAVGAVGAGVLWSVHPGLLNALLGALP
jgi:hypothetical protein